MNLSPLVANYQPPTLLDAERQEHVPPSRIFRVLLRRKLLILAGIVCLSLPGAIIIKALEPYYDATALLMIDTRKSSFRDLQATVATPDSDLVAIATQVGILRSPSLAATVVDKLDLTHEPEFTRILDVPPSWMQRIMAQVLTWLNQPLPSPTQLSLPERRQLTSSILLDKMAIINDSKSYIITIRARTNSPRLSAAIANSFVDVYLDFKQQRKIAAVHNANALLDVQLALLAARVTKADQAVENYRATNGLILSRLTGGGQGDGGGTTVADQQLAQINNQLITASGELAQKQASLRQIEAALRGGQLDAIPEVVSSALINNLRAQQLELNSRAASIGQNHLSNNPSMLSALAAQGEVQQRINYEISKIATSVRNQASIAESQVQILQAALTRLQGQVGIQSQANVPLRQLESEARAARGIYQDYLGRFEQTLSQSSLQEAEADQVSTAAVPIAKSGPPRGLYLILVVLIATFLTCLLTLLLDRLRQGVRTVEQLEAQTGLFGLGFLPVAPRNLQRLFQTSRPSMYSESVSIVSNLLQFGQERYRARVVLVTSAIPNEGKTFFALSLAANVGREGRTALLIDCDMRRPSVAKVMGLETSLDQTETAAVFHRAVLPGLDIVTFGPPQTSAREVVSSAKIQNLLDEARLHYDMIVLDTPPVLPFADAPILSLKADGAIMVVRWRHTPSTVVAGAVKMLNAYGVRLLGGVVVRVKPNEVAATEGSHTDVYRHYSSYFR